MEVLEQIVFTRTALKALKHNIQITNIRLLHKSNSSYNENNNDDINGKDINTNSDAQTNNRDEQKDIEAYRTTPSDPNLILRPPKSILTDKCSPGKYYLLQYFQSRVPKKPYYNRGI